MIVVGADQRGEHRGLELEALDVGSGREIALQLADLDQVVREDERGGEAVDLEVLHQARTLRRRPRCRPAAGRSPWRSRANAGVENTSCSSRLHQVHQSAQRSTRIGLLSALGDRAAPRRGRRANRRRRRRRADRRQRHGQTESEGEKGGQQLWKAPRRTSSSGLDQGRGLARDDTIRLPHETRSSALADRRVRDDEGRAAGGRAQGAGHRRRELRSGRARLRIAGGGGRGGARGSRRGLHQIYGGDRARGSAARAARSLPPRVERALERARPGRDHGGRQGGPVRAGARGGRRGRRGRHPDAMLGVVPRPGAAVRRPSGVRRVARRRRLPPPRRAGARRDHAGDAGDRPQLALQPDRRHDRRRRSARHRRGRGRARHPGGLRRDLRALRLRRTGIHQLRRLRRRASRDGGGGGLVLEDLRHDRLAHRLRAGAAGR